MKIKFTSGAGFAGFDGLERTCVKFHRVRGGVYRCRKFSSRVGKHPKACAPGLVSRSPGLIRVGRGCGGARFKRVSARTVKATLCAQRCAGRRGKTLRKCLRKCSRKKRRR